LKFDSFRWPSRTSTITSPTSSLSFLLHYFGYVALMSSRIHVTKILLTDKFQNWVSQQNHHYYCLCCVSKKFTSKNFISSSVKCEKFFHIFSSSSFSGFLRWSLKHTLDVNGSCEKKIIKHRNMKLHLLETNDKLFPCMRNSISLWICNEKKIKIKERSKTRFRGAIVAFINTLMIFYVAFMSWCWRSKCAWGYKLESIETKWRIKVSSSALTQIIQISNYFFHSSDMVINIAHQHIQLHYQQPFYFKPLRSHVHVRFCPFRNDK
jgi:hypothetical protein